MKTKVHVMLGLSNFLSTQNKSTIKDKKANLPQQIHDLFFRLALTQIN